MADNIKIITVDGERVIRTSDENGVHYPHNYIRLFDTQGEEYASTNPLPVRLQQIGGSPIVVESGAIEVRINHENDSISIWGNTLPDGTGSPIAVLVDEAGHLQVDVVEGGWTEYTVNTIPPPDYVGALVVGVQTGSPTSISTNGSYAPLQFDQNGRLLVSLGTAGFTGSFKTADSPPRTVTVTNGFITSVF